MSLYAQGDIKLMPLQQSLLDLHPKVKQSSVLKAPFCLSIANGQMASQSVWGAYLWDAGQHVSPGGRQNFSSIPYLVVGCTSFSMILNPLPKSFTALIDCAGNLDGLAMLTEELHLQPVDST